MPQPRLRPPAEADAIAAGLDWSEVSAFLRFAESKEGQELFAKTRTTRSLIEAARNLGPLAEADTGEEGPYFVAWTMREVQWAALVFQAFYEPTDEEGRDFLLRRAEKIITYLAVDGAPSVEEWAELCGVSATTVHKWIDADKTTRPGPERLRKMSDRLYTQSKLSYLWSEWATIIAQHTAPIQVGRPKEKKE